MLGRRAELFCWEDRGLLKVEAVTGCSETDIRLSMCLQITETDKGRLNMSSKTDGRLY